MKQESDLANALYCFITQCRIEVEACIKFHVTLCEIMFDIVSGCLQVAGKVRHKKGHLHAA